MRRRIASRFGAVNSEDARQREKGRIHSAKAREVVSRWRGTSCRLSACSVGCIRCSEAAMSLLENRGGRGERDLRTVLTMDHWQLLHGTNFHDSNGRLEIVTIVWWRLVSIQCPARFDSVRGDDELEVEHAKWPKTDSARAGNIASTERDHGARCPAPTRQSTCIQLAQNCASQRAGGAGVHFAQNRRRVCGGAHHIPKPWLSAAPRSCRSELSGRVLRRMH